MFWNKLWLLLESSLPTLRIESHSTRIEPLDLTIIAFLYHFSHLKYLDVVVIEHAYVIMKNGKIKMKRNMLVCSINWVVCELFLLLHQLLQCLAIIAVHGQVIPRL